MNTEVHDVGCDYEFVKKLWFYTDKKNTNFRKFLDEPSLEKITDFWLSVTGIILGSLASLHFQNNYRPERSRVFADIRCVPPHLFRSNKAKSRQIS